MVLEDCPKRNLGDRNILFAAHAASAHASPGTYCLDLDLLFGWRRRLILEQLKDKELKLVIASKIKHFTKNRMTRSAQLPLLGGNPPPGG